MSYGKRATVFGFAPTSGASMDESAIGWEADMDPNPYVTASSFELTFPDAILMRNLLPSRPG
jgi:hypothetical protein